MIVATHACRGLVIVFLVLGTAVVAAGQSPDAGYQALVKLFGDFVSFERPPLKSGAPDYSAATIAARRVRLKEFQTRLAALDPSRWPVPQQVDHALVKAEMNGLDFNLRVLQPWARDPAFYQSVWMERSDTPAHEGPTHHAVVEVWTYAFPLSAEAATRLARELRSIPPLLTQARTNLIGTGRDLWITGTGTMAQQVADLEDLRTQVPAGSQDLAAALFEAQGATAAFVRWLEQQARLKTGPSGVGKANYTWHLQNVQLVPMTWNDEVTLLKRELARAHASLKLEEARNQGLPALTAAADAKEYTARANAAVTKYLAWLKAKDVLTVQDYLDEAMRAHVGGFTPMERRNFFGIASHYEPMTLFAHWYHWFDHAWMERAANASPIRRGATLFNVWANRSEGMATAMEEIVLHAGYYDDNPRAKEIVWIMLAQRCARGLASLYAQANEFDIKQAKAFQVEWTPRGWMRPDLDLLNFEQQLYLRQPGYGTSYVTGKYLIDELMKDRAHQLGDAFTLRKFFDEFNAAGLIPVTLIRRQMTGGK
jgi:hypothetical protein